MSELLSGALRPSIRTRLALVYGGVFFCMGVGLIAVSYAIVDHSPEPGRDRWRGLSRSLAAR